MNDTVMVMLILAGTIVVALAIDRGIPNALESAADSLEDVAAGMVASLRATAAKLRERHAEIEATNRQRRSLAANPVPVLAKRGCSAA
jgi:hypothetical protein